MHSTLRRISSKLHILDDPGLFPLPIPRKWQAFLIFPARSVGNLAKAGRPLYYPPHRAGYLAEDSEIGPGGRRSDPMLVLAFLFTALLFVAAIFSTFVMDRSKLG